MVFQSKEIPFIPISAWLGDNVINKSQNMPWYKGFSVEINKNTITGYTLLDALNNAIVEPKRFNNKSFRMPISWIYSNNIVNGKIVQGTIKKGQIINIFPSRVKAKVESLQLNDKSVDAGYAGDNIGMKLDIIGNNSSASQLDIKQKSKNREKKSLYKRGDIIVMDNDPNPLSMVRKFIAETQVVLSCCHICILYDTACSN